jgi:hypothetical protein
MGGFDADDFALARYTYCVARPGTLHFATLLKVDWLSLVRGLATRKHAACAKLDWTDTS